MTKHQLSCATTEGQTECVRPQFWRWLIVSSLPKHHCVEKRPSKKGKSIPVSPCPFNNAGRTNDLISLNNTAHQSPKVISKQNKTVIVPWWIERGCWEEPWKEDSQGLVHTWERWCLGATAPLLTSKNVVGRKNAPETEVNVLLLQGSKGTS